MRAALSSPPAGLSSGSVPDFMDDGDESAWDCLVHSAAEQPNPGLGTAESGGAAKRDAGEILGKGAAGAGSPD